MSGKQNIFQKIKGWFKSTRRRKIQENSVSKLFLNAVIKKPDLMPIYKKSSTPPFKSILKNNCQKEEDLLKINLMANDIMETQFADKDIYGDSKLGKFVGDSKVLNEKRNRLKKYEGKTKQDSINTSEKQLLKTKSNTLSNSNNINSNQDLDEKEMSASQSLASLDRYSQLSNLPYRKRNKKRLSLIKREDTISRMNVFQKDSSFICYRKAAIKRFQNIKTDKEKMSRCASDYSNVVISSDMEMFDVIMDNTLERYPSQCLLDISSALENESFLLYRKPSTSKNSDSLINEPLNSSECCSNETFGIDSSVPSCSGNVPVLENRSLKKKKK